MKKLVYILSIFAILFAFGSCEKEVVTPVEQVQDEIFYNHDGGTRGGDTDGGSGSVTDPDEDDDFDEEEDGEIVDPDEDEDFDEEEKKDSENPLAITGK